VNAAGLALVLCLAAESPPDAGTSDPPALTEGVTRPRLLTGPPRLHGLYVRGLVLVKCRVLVNGLLEDCAIMTPDGNPAQPALVEIIRDWAARARLEPATFEGKPVEVPYVFHFNFR
jgi:hypothetical protein